MICEAEPLGGTTKFGSAPLEDMEETRGWCNTRWKRRARNPKAPAQEELPM